MVTFCSDIVKLQCHYNEKILHIITLPCSDMLKLLCHYKEKILYIYFLVVTFCSDILKIQYHYNEKILYTNQGQIQDFLLGGANPSWRGHQPLTQALFGENICKNERIWSCWRGHTPETFVCRSTTANFSLWKCTLFFAKERKFSILVIFPCRSVHFSLQRKRKFSVYILM